MKIRKILVGSALAMAALAGCLATTDGPPSDGPGPDDAQVDGMVSPCVAEATRMTGTGLEAIAVTESRNTGDGLTLVLNVAGARYACRQGPDGSVTVYADSGT